MITHLQKQTRELKAIAERMQRENIRQIAEITYSHERGNGPEWKISVNEETAGLLGIDEIPDELFSIAMMLKNQMSMPMDFSTAFEAAKLITESFRVSHK